MSVHWILLSIFVHFGNSSPPFSPQQASNGRTKSIPVVDALIASLEPDPWGPDDGDCLQATLDMLWGVKNDTLWAVWVWDSVQPPVGSLYGKSVHIGSYDQCLQAPWVAVPGLQSLRTQYCLVDVKIDAVGDPKTFKPFESAAEYYKTPTKTGNCFNKQTFGVCFPAVCRPSSVTRIFRHMYQLTHLPDGDMYVDPRDCQRSGEAIGYSWGFYGFWALIAMFATLAVYSTIYNNNDTKSTNFGLISKSFCIRRNYNSLFKVNKEDIKVMNGMRFLTAGLIVAVHEGFYGLQTPFVNGLDVDKMMNTFFGVAMIHLELIVDTFFAMSGLLLIRGLIMGRQRNVVYTLLKRYIRLIVPMVLCTLYLATGAVVFSNDGPLWRRANRDEVETCAKSWWRSLLMYNNDLDTMCHAVTWYVSCDFQLAILAVFLFSLFRRNKILGAIVFMAVAAGLTLNLGWVVYWKRLDVLPFGWITTRMHLVKKHSQLNDTYLNTSSRAGSYLVGMVMGYIITVYKPAENRNSISKKWSTIIITLSLITNVAMLSIGNIFLCRPYNPLEAAVAVASNRVLWAVAICCIIGACEYGSAPLVSDLLSWPGFVPLSKLSYCLYLVHPFVLQSQKYAARSADTYGIFPMIINSFGVLVVGCAASFVLYLMVEAPFINISNELFTEKPKSAEQNGTKIKSTLINHSSIGAEIHQNGYEHIKSKIS